jgi:hypothetical protein
MSFPKAATEAGFLRLVAWAYGCFFESGRISVPFLTSRPFGNTTPDDVEFSRKTLAALEDLRTYLFHNLPPSKRNNALRERVKAWFVETCSETEPRTEEQWAQSYERVRSLLVRLSSILLKAIGALAEVEYSETVEDLLFRLNTGLPAYKYDTFIQELAQEGGIDINVRAFRDRYLNEWQQKAKLLGAADIEDAMRKVVCKTLHDFVADLS